MYRVILILLFLLSLVCASKAQKGSWTIIPSNGNYEVKLTSMPKSPAVGWVTRTLKLSITCMSSMQTSQLDLPLAGMGLKMKGEHRLSLRVYYFNQNGILVATQCVPENKCITGTSNIAQCWE